MGEPANEPSLDHILHNLEAIRTQLVTLQSRINKNQEENAAQRAQLKLLVTKSSLFAPKLSRRGPTVTPPQNSPARKGEDPNLSLSSFCKARIDNPEAFKQAQNFSDEKGSEQDSQRKRPAQYTPPRYTKRLSTFSPPKDKQTGFHPYSPIAGNTL